MVVKSSKSVFFSAQGWFRWFLRRNHPFQVRKYGSRLLQSKRSDCLSLKWIQYLWKSSHKLGIGSLASPSHRLSGGSISMTNIWNMWSNRIIYDGHWWVQCFMDVRIKARLSIRRVDRSRSRACGNVLGDTGPHYRGKRPGALTGNMFPNLRMTILSNWSSKSALGRKKDRSTTINKNNCYLVMILEYFEHVPMIFSISGALRGEFPFNPTI